eukprot:CAMPEP_0117446808 /NCGR_PEP_ID=MMETSP0759-20121206/6541_1 /TAXON_ID=63605 /ORGANISM="Percolomonas cosmopolitus, Strain WS" /LENGTH=341 /DNA_ID=CAMNT_0005239105 /DNA_START=36 /DNA_END=1061 /DNA_ORIENTATION=+
MTQLTNKKFTLIKHPVGDNIKECFKMQSESINLEDVPEGHVVIQNVYISLDPAMRIWISGKPSYREPVKLNAVMDAAGVGIVLKGGKNLNKGDYVTGGLQWQQYAVLPENQVMKVDQLSPVYLNELGHIGQTAYWGLVDRGHIKKGDEVFISAAAGAVGSLACQIAKIKGCRVVGTAGSEEKVKYLQEELGIEAFNYKDVPKGEMKKVLAKHFPRGIDLYFDNVGGEMLEASLDNISLEARVVICGAISQYNSNKAPQAPRNYIRLLFKQATMSGFIISNYFSRFPEAVKEMLPWVQEGKLRGRSDIQKGFEKMPETLEMLFTGANKGKLIVQVSETQSKL